MFTDPQSITINSVAKSMPRIMHTGLSSTYITGDELFKLTISHQKSKQRLRSMVRVDQRAIVPDPLTSVNDWETFSFHCVIDRPEVGFSVTQVEHLIVGVETWLDTAAIAALYGQQS